MKKQYEIQRGNFGEIVGIEGCLDYELLAQAHRILDASVIAEDLPAAYVDVDKKHRGSALNYDLYDIDVSRGKVRVALYQQRETTCTKWGNSPTKNYFLLTAGRGKTPPTLDWLDDARKRRVVRLARHSVQAGEIIEVLTRRDQPTAAVAA